MTEKKYTRLPIDREIIYTDRELADKKYRFEDAIKTAEAIHKDRGYGPLRFAIRHRERFSLLTSQPMNIAEKNAVITDILGHEHEYTRRNPVIIPQKV